MMFCKRSRCRGSIAAIGVRAKIKMLAQRALVKRATESDRSVIEDLIRQHSDTLQQGIRFSFNEYTLVKLYGETLGCCALKAHGRKLAEIWSLAYPPGEVGRAVAKLLLEDCERRAQGEKIRQLLIIARDAKFFGKLGYHTFNEEKYALLKSMASVQPYPTVSTPSVIIRPAEEGDEQSITKLIAMYPRKLVQDPTLRPKTADFMVAVVGGNVVGCCALDAYSLELAEIRSLVVHPEFVGKRLSRWLIAGCINRAIESGVSELLAITGAKMLFEEFGFSTLRGAEYALLKVLENGSEKK